MPAPRPSNPTMAGAHPAHAVGQILGISAMTAGVLLLFGLPWALTIGGFAIFVGTVVTQAAPPPRPDGR